MRVLTKYKTKIFCDISNNKDSIEKISLYVQNIVKLIIQILIQNRFQNEYSYIATDYGSLFYLALVLNQKYNN